MRKTDRKNESGNASLRLKKIDLWNLLPSRESRQKLSPEERRMAIADILPQGVAWMVFVQRFYILLAISVIIATTGLVTNSSAVVIGAMLIAPMMVPILGLGAALVLGWWRHQVRLVLFIFLGGLFTIGLAYLVVFLYQAPQSMPIPGQVLSRTHPGVGDLAVALSAGMAAAFMQVRRETLSALPGVAISVALVPPLASAGVLLYFAEYVLMQRAILLFLTNASAIVLSASLVFLVMGVKPPIRNKQLGFKVIASNAIAAVAVVIVAVPLVLQTVNVYREIREHALAASIVEEWITHNRVLMEDVRVRRNRVEVDVQFRIPLAELDDQESIKPRQWIPGDMTRNQLESALTKALDRSIQVSLSGEFHITN